MKNKTPGQFLTAQYNKKEGIKHIPHRIIFIPSFFSHMNLYRISSCFRISNGCIHTLLLCFTVFKEIGSNLWEQCIG